MLELVPQLLPQTVTGTCCRNEVAVATYFLIEVAAATSHNHAYRAFSHAISLAELKKLARSVTSHGFNCKLLIVGDSASVVRVAVVTSRHNVDNDK